MWRAGLPAAAAQKIASDPVYREVCRDSSRKWRARNADYWKSYREAHPAVTERNCQQQMLRSGPVGQCSGCKSIPFHHAAA